MLSRTVAIVDNHPMEEKKINTILKNSDIFEGKGVDSIYFRKIEKPEKIQWKFHFGRFTGPVKLEHNEDLDCDKWLIVLFEPNEEDTKQVVYFQAYLGDPVVFVNNHVAADCEGVVIRKSAQGFQILIKMMSAMPPGNVIKSLIYDEAEHNTLS